MVYELTSIKVGDWVKTKAFAEPFKVVAFEFGRWLLWSQSGQTIDTTGLDGFVQCDAPEDVRDGEIIHPHTEALAAADGLNWVSSSRSWLISCYFCEASDQDEGTIEMRELIHADDCAWVEARQIMDRYEAAQNGGES